MAGGHDGTGCTWQGGMHGSGVWQGACMAGACMVGGMHGREEPCMAGGMCGREEPCMVGGMCGRGMHGGGHAWEEACVAGGMHGRGCAWWGCGCMCGKGACVAGYAHSPQDTMRYGQ